MTTAWTQMDGLLTCPMCNERYRNPKLLPCQHTYCMEPCLEKLTTEGTKHQLKCPDCGAEHRVPFHGIQAFPNNVTLTRFLELRVSLNGENPEPPPSLQRCAVCNEKERLDKCCHCGKKVCQSCRKAHSAILKQEIMLINGQVKAGLANLSDTLSATQKNKEKIQDNRQQVKNKIEEVVNRYINDLSETEAKLKHELDVYLYCELRNIKKLKHDLELEIHNITSNCELVEKHMNNGIEWTDVELVDYKEIFQRALDFVRNFEVDTSDYSRRVRFQPKTETEAFRKTLKEFGEVKDCPAVVAAPLHNGLIVRSQSDHRLAMQHQRQDDVQSSEPPLRRFDRNARERSVEREMGRHGGDEYLSPWRREEALRNRAQSRDCSPEPPRIIEERPERIIETEDATKGPISKVVRLLDSSHIMAKMHQSEVRQKQQQKEQERKAQQPPPRPAVTYQPRQLQRQTSEDDVDKQKKQNQAAAAAAERTDTSRNRGRVTESPKPREEIPARSTRASTETETSVDSSRRDSQKPPVSPRQSLQPLRPPRVPAGRSSTSENTEEKTRPSSSRPRVTPLTIPTPEKTEEPETRKKPFYSRFLARNKEADKKSSSSDSSSDSDDEESRKKSNRGDMSPSVSELLARSAQARRQSLTSQSLGIRPLYPTEGSSRNWRDAVRRDKDDNEKESVLTSRRRRQQAEEQEEEPSYTRYSERRKSLAVVEPSGSSGSRYRNRISRSKSSHDIALGEESAEEDLSSVRSRLRQSRSAREISPARETGSWSQYIKSKYGQRNRPSPAAGTDDSSDEEEKIASRRRDSLLSRYGDSYGTAFSRRTYMQKGKSTMKFGARGSEPGCFTWPRGVAVGQDVIAVADSSNHRVQIFNSNGKFLHEFGTYGSGEGEFDCLAAVTVTKNGHYVISDRYNHRLQVFDPTGRFIRCFGCEGRADGKFNYPWGLAADSLGFIYVCDKENHRIQVFQMDGTYVSKFGSLGSRPGEMEHPHYIAVSNTNRVIVSDSNNHRIQIFDVNGRLLSTFGSEGIEDGQFRFPRGVAVDEQGYVIVGDSGNNRIQIFQPDGTFLKAFGSWGSGDGEFKGLEGIAVNSNSGILVCDRENHRIQVF